ncbi:hypothetical protein PHISCL_01453 [Aspergillus sclerotialis]|uniref:Uncharacterized protein n=1 Tax=Aspergillus sclerotialis TaxID=2070753 RepID=A0A3A3A8B4_9EURO|nr:hypothetical protein PHISCL_01453 [Aspergillus sclerotialis]
MAPQTVLGHCFFSREEVQLASLIPNIKDIDLDALESVVPLQSNDYTVKDVDDITRFFKACSDNSFQALLARIVGWSSNRSKQANISLAAHKGRIYTLRKPSLWFRRLCEQAEVKTWLQEQIEDGNDSVYFVVGLHTYSDAVTSEGLALVSEHGGGIAAHISYLPVGGAGDIALSVNHERSQNGSSSYIVPGEQIFAIRLKKVILRTWRPQDVSNLRLAKHSHWLMTPHNRSSGGDYSEILEAFLEGDSDREHESSADHEGHWELGTDVLMSEATYFTFV